MASKGQKFKKYSLDLKEEILKKYLSGEFASKLEAEYGVPAATIATWKYKMDHFKGLNFPGRPKKAGLSAEDYKERYEILKKYQAFLEAQRKKR